MLLGNALSSCVRIRTVRIQIEINREARCSGQALEVPDADVDLPSEYSNQRPRPREFAVRMLDWASRVCFGVVYLPVVMRSSLCKQSAMTLTTTKMHCRRQMRGRSWERVG